MNETQLRSLGLSMLFLGIAVGGIARSSHLSSSMSTAGSVISALFSFTAIGLFFKASPGRRGRLVIGIAVVVLVATAMAVFMLMPH